MQIDAAADLVAHEVIRIREEVLFEGLCGNELNPLIDNSALIEISFIKNCRRVSIMYLLSFA